MTLTYCPDEPTPALTAREVCQVLRDAIFGRRTMIRACVQTWEELYAGMFMVDVEGWSMTIFNDCDELDYCETCVSTDGRRWSFDSGDRYGTDPIALLSTWEHQTLESLLKAL
ncbi:DUF7693 family protein [Pseudomonas syringae]|uniref:DUF7693 family protein n=2 Tax=Pseudomonas syringae group TaxID=136849 RepID=UPI000760BC7D|nr:MULTISPECIES: hypothetical protein [Pseudomonas syringae group]MCI3911824.1 hypothetical protein [Pseudomonas viridiflava]MCK9730304.1 hypothetical protein [Pseudomonas syringae pv. syringae]